MIKIIIIFIALILIYYISYYSYRFCFCQKKSEEEYVDIKKVGFDDNITVILFDKDDTINETKKKNMIYKIYK